MSAPHRDDYEQTVPAAAPEPPWVVAARKIASTPFLRQENDGKVTWVETIRLACIAHAEAHAAALAQENERLRDDCMHAAVTLNVQLELEQQVADLAQELLDTRARYTQAFAERERFRAERDAWLRKVQYVTQQLAAMDDGATPVEELAQRAAETIAKLAQERDALKCDFELERIGLNHRLRETAKERDHYETERNELRLANERLTAERDRYQSALDAIFKTELRTNEEPFEVWDRMTEIARSALAPTQKEEAP